MLAKSMMKNPKDFLWIRIPGTSFDQDLGVAPECKERWRLALSPHNEGSRLPSF